MDWQKFLDKAEAQRFGPNDSMIVSSIMHPQEALARGLRKLGENIQTAGNPYSTPDEAVKAGLDIAGIAMTGLMPFGPKGAGGTFGAIPLSHGSPHGPFKQFDLSELGTGAGAQAYGHGIYFGEGYNSPVAMRYAPRNEKLENKLQDLYDIAERRDQYPAMEVYEQYMLNKAPEDVEKYIGEVLPDYSKSEQMTMKQAHELAKKAYQGQKGSYLYNADLKWTDPTKEAEMPMSEEHFLHWDKPLHEQSDYVKKALYSMPLITDNLTAKLLNGEQGSDIYNALINATELSKLPKTSERFGVKGSAETASNYLNSIGIPGIRYFDPEHGSGKSLQNFVIFNPKTADILSINSKAIAKKLRGNQ